MKRKKELCTCGCGTSYIIGTDTPVKVEILKYCNDKEKSILEIKVIDTGLSIRLGDTLKRKSATGRKYKKIVVFNITNGVAGFLVWGYVVDQQGMVRIDNDTFAYLNAQNPNTLRYLYK